MQKDKKGLKEKAYMGLALPKDKNKYQIAFLHEQIDEDAIFYILFYRSFSLLLYTFII